VERKAGYPGPCEGTAIGGAERSQRMPSSFSVQVSIIKACGCRFGIVQDQDLLLSRRIKWGATEGTAYAMVVQQKNIVSLASNGLGYRLEIPSSWFEFVSCWFFFLGGVGGERVVSAS